MTTVQEFVTVKLAATYDLCFDEAREIVADEVHTWRIAQIFLPWGQDITEATLKFKSLAWYSVEQAYNRCKNQKGKYDER